MKDLSNENVIHINKDGVQFLQFRKLLEYKEYINHAYGLGLDMNFRTAKIDKKALNEKEYDYAIQCYKKLAEQIQTNYINLVKTKQEHTDEVKIARSKIKDNEPDFNLEEYSKTDGLITNRSNLLLSTTNADCILIMFFDPIKKVIANIHSGWRGTVQRISVKTVRKMISEFDCNPENIICCICPSIRKCHFEVEKEVKEIFEKEFKDFDKSILNQIIEEKIYNKKWNIDTISINKILLQNEGIKSKNIIDSKICSVCNCDVIHSYRIEKQGYGLNTALIELK